MVETRSGPSRVMVGSGILSEVSAVMTEASMNKVLLLADRRFAELDRINIPRLVPESLEVVRVDMEVSERSKSLEEVGKICELMAENGFRRSDAVLTLGGGAVSDVGGFVASVYARGLDVVHLPSTLLAQVDASIGGKTGVNLRHGKNLVGTFHQPLAVIADVDLLSSLPDAEWRSGMAEVIKYWLCFRPDVLDGSQWSTLDRSDPGAVEEMVATCAEIKAQVVSGDERDEGSRLFLNYGHTVGHALEAASGYSMKHGEAISVGMVFAARLSVALGLASEDLVSIHIEVLARHGLPTSWSFHPDEVEKAWALDKKNLSTQRWVLLSALGAPVVREDVPVEMAREVLRTVNDS